MRFHKIEKLQLSLRRNQGVPVFLSPLMCFDEKCISSCFLDCIRGETGLMSSQFPSRDLPQFLYVCKRTSYNFLLQVTYDQINMVLGIYYIQLYTMIYVLLKLHFLPEIQVVTLLQHLFGDVQGCSSSFKTLCTTM